MEAVAQRALLDQDTVSGGFRRVVTFASRSLPRSLIGEKIGGARLIGGEIMQEKPSRPPPVPPEPPKVAPGREQGNEDRAQLIARLDNGKAKADWEQYDRWLDAMLGS